MIDSVIFDFDGTLTELTLDFNYLRKEILWIASQFLPYNKLENLNSLYIIEMIYEVERLLCETGKLFSQKAFKKLEELEIAAAEGKGLFPYSRDVLRSLKERGIKIGIITRSCLSVLKKVFPDISEYSQAISTREHIKYVKPDPRHVKHVLNEISVKAENTMLVGDHPTDIIAGQKAGVITVGVLSGRTNKQAFIEVGADFIVDDIRGVLPIVDLIKKN